MGPVVRVSAPQENIHQVWAYADPADARYMIACGMFADSLTNAYYGYVYSSSDGGVTWRRTLLDNASRFVSEESCTFGKNGYAYFAAGESDMSTGRPRHEWGHLQLFFSPDHGQTWKSAGRREFVDWTMLIATPAGKQHAEKLVIFGNGAADREGHWFEKRPVAIEATDNAQALSSLIPSPVQSSGNFGGGSVALPDGTALFLVSVTDPKYANDPGFHRQMNVFAYTSSDHTLSVRAKLRDVPGRTMGLYTTIAQDMSNRFHGRLYAAWSDIERSGSDAQLWLSTSDDKGFHWSSRPIFSMPDYKISAGCPRNPFGLPPDIRIAVNRYGTLALLWTLNAQTMQFAQSLDGGRTFQPGALVVNQPRGELSVDEGVNFNERWLAEHLANIRGVSREELSKYNDVSHLGLSVRMAKPRGIGDFALTADDKNSFHALWSAAVSDGGHALMTRKIDLPLSAGTRSELNGVGLSSRCDEDAGSLNVEALSAIPAMEVSGQTDISGSLNLHVDHVEYSPESHIVTATVTLTNKEVSSSLRPVSLVALDLHSDFGVATPLNADGTLQGQPFWNIASVAPEKGAKVSAKPIQLRFKIDQFHVVPTGNAVAMYILVFANDAAHPRL